MKGGREERKDGGREEKEGRDVIMELIMNKLIPTTLGTAAAATNCVNAGEPDFLSLPYCVRGWGWGSSQRGPA
jgi:hypothetical protein